MSPPREATTPSPRVLALGGASALGLWLAQAPAGWWPLAWVAPVGWLLVAQSAAPLGRLDVVKLWLTGVLYWLLTVHWVRLPHPLTPLGWPPLAMYLALYVVVAVVLVRAAVRRGAPLWLAAPVVWTGLELLQARLFTGFLMGAVSHSQAGQPWLRGVAAYAGAYGVSFLVVLCAGALAAALRRRSPAAWGGAAAALGLAVALGLLAQSTTVLQQRPGAAPRVALVQGDTRATWDADPGRAERIMERQLALTRDALALAQRDGRALDLVVWPECMFRSPLVTFDGAMTPPDDADAVATERAANSASWFEVLAGATGGAAALVGIDRFDIVSRGAGGPSEQVYNSAALVDGAGKLLGYYDKTHLVPFGEYIPFASGMPALYYLTPMSGGLAEGAGPVALEAPRRTGGPLRLCPTICYETVVPHVVRRHVATLTADGGRPDALVNVTNDAWFWGSSELDLHLACGVYRAVETGLPLIVAANGGLSAVIDATGRVTAVGPRMAERAVVADLPPRTARPTPYARAGDLFAGLCLAACGAVAIAELLGAIRRTPPVSVG